MEGCLFNNYILGEHFNDTLWFYLSKNSGSVYLHSEYPNWTVCVGTPNGLSSHSIVICLFLFIVFIQ